MARSLFLLVVVLCVTSQAALVPPTSSIRLTDTKSNKLSRILEAAQSFRANSSKSGKFKSKPVPAERTVSEFIQADSLLALQLFLNAYILLNSFASLFLESASLRRLRMQTLLASALSLIADLYERLDVSSANTDQRSERSPSNTLDDQDAARQRGDGLKSQIPVTTYCSESISEINQIVSSAEGQSLAYCLLALTCGSPVGTSIPAALTATAFVCRYAIALCLAGTSTSWSQGWRGNVMRSLLWHPSSSIASTDSCDVLSTPSTKPVPPKTRERRKKRTDDDSNVGNKVSRGGVITVKSVPWFHAVGEQAVWAIELILAVTVAAQLVANLFSSRIHNLKDFIHTLCVLVLTLEHVFVRFQLHFSSNSWLR